jgi:hypothetical protein
MGKPLAMPPTLLDQLVYLSLLMGKLDLAIDHEGLPMALYLPFFFRLYKWWGLFDWPLE